MKIYFLCYFMNDICPKDKEYICDQGFYEYVTWIFHSLCLWHYSHGGKYVSFLSNIWPDRTGVNMFDLYSAKLRKSFKWFRVSIWIHCYFMNDTCNKDKEYIRYHDFRMWPRFLRICDLNAVHSIYLWHYSHDYIHVCVWPNSVSLSNMWHDWSG